MIFSVKWLWTLYEKGANFQPFFVPEVYTLCGFLGAFDVYLPKSKVYL